MLKTAASLLSVGVVVSSTAAQAQNFADFLLQHSNGASVTRTSSFSTTAEVSFDQSVTVSGVDASNAPQTMSVRARTFADGRNATLRASSSLDITNFFYNSSNPELVALGFGQFSGLPDTYIARSQARFQDSLSITAAAAISTVSIDVRVTGQLSASTSIGELFTSGANVFLLSGNQTAFTRSLFDPAAGPVSIDQIVTISNLPLVNGRVALDLRLQADTSWSISDAANWMLPQGADLFQSSDFDNTAVVSAVRAFDASGGQVAISEVRGVTSGLTYTIPSPGMGGVMLAGVMVLTRRRR